MAGASLAVLVSSAPFNACHSELAITHVNTHRRPLRRSRTVDHGSASGACTTAPTATPLTTTYAAAPLPCGHCASATHKKHQCPRLGRAPDDAEDVDLE